MRFIRWLKREARGRNFWCYTILFALANFIYVLLFFLVLVLIGIDVMPREYSPIFLLRIIRYWYKFLPWMFYAIIREEFIFRLLPLGLGLRLARVLKKDPLFLLIFLSISFSAVFGLGHGRYTNILIQGMVGLSWCVLFLKCGGFQGKYLKAFSATLLSHLLYNLFILANAFFYSFLLVKI